MFLFCTMIYRNSEKTFLNGLGVMENSWKKRCLSSKIKYVEIRSKEKWNTGLFLEIWQPVEKHNAL